MAKRKTQKRKKSFSPIKFLLVMAIFVVSVALIIEFVDFKAIFSSFNKTESTSVSQTTDSQDTSPSSSDTSKPNDENHIEPPKEEEKVPQYEGENPNSSNDITGTVSHASVSNNKLILRITIDQYLNSGTCALKMTHQDGTSYQSTVNVAESASTSTCEGFDISTSALKSGKWSVVITVNSNGKSGKITTEVQI